MKDYHIVKIADEKTIIINAGTRDDVAINDKFEIYDNENEIIDPITNENLGTIPLLKEVVTVQKVYEKLSICKCVVNTGMLNTASNTLAQLIGSEFKTLNVDKSEISGGLKSSSKIKVGDLVRKKVNLPLPTPKSTND